MGVPALRDFRSKQLELIRNDIFSNVSASCQVLLFPAAGKVTKRAAAAFYCYQVSALALLVHFAIKRRPKRVERGVYQVSSDGCLSNTQADTQNSVEGDKGHRLNFKYSRTLIIKLKINHKNYKI
ncbi:MAG TPA: hypothetical protein VEV16_10005 [Daejeonella sp.]|nr:hypothetical protein [Daejeonella sp.]